MWTFLSVISDSLNKECNSLLKLMLVLTILSVIQITEAQFDSVGSADDHTQKTVCYT